MNDFRKDIHNKLLLLGEGIKKVSISDLSKKNGFKDNNIKSDLLTFDYSKQRINNEALDYLLQIPDLINLKESLNLLFKGEINNPSEDRAVSHTLYRNRASVDGFELIFSERKKIRAFLKQIHSDYSFKNLICISIGGSRLGPELLNEFQSLDGPIKIHFCSSYDLQELRDTLCHCQQKETLVLASSKSFETSEIIKNLNFVKSWFAQEPDLILENHLYGISANSAAMTSHGIKEKNKFIIKESLGGRFSIWSSISLPAFVNTNYESYSEFLEGAYLADEYTHQEQWSSNISVMMALLSVWNTNALNINNHGIFTYNFKLRSLTKYLAQLSMESNGKSVNFDSYVSPFFTSPLVWGGYGIENQHSTFQWLMQGKTEATCDFIGINDGHYDNIDSHEMLLSQVLAMTYGLDDKKNPYKSVKGNNPCNIMQLHSLDLKSLGFLLALYEHKIFIEALILGINPFDQWGVQLGKKLASDIKGNQEFLRDYFSSSVLPKS
jgi:glucose-6-phosphate isomerase